MLLIKKNSANECLSYMGGLSQSFGSTENCQRIFLYIKTIINIFSGSKFFKKILCYLNFNSFYVFLVKYIILEL